MIDWTRPGVIPMKLLLELRDRREGEEKLHALGPIAYRELACPPGLKLTKIVP
jgi:hypothetical protein